MSTSDRAPDCATSLAAAIAGIIASAVMSGEMSINGETTDGIEARFAAAGLKVAWSSDVEEGFRVAGLMISARARASVRTPTLAAISAAESALALAEDALENFAPTAGLTTPAAGKAIDDLHAAMGSIVDTLRAGLDPLHAAEVEPQAPYDAGPPRA